MPHRPPKSQQGVNGVPSAIPQRDGDFDAYLNNWRTLLTAAPATYGMLAADATAITNSYNIFHAAYLLVTNPATRTHAQVVAKDIAKASALVLLRDQYGIIKANPAVLDASKTTIGIRVNDPIPTPIPPPSTYPLLSVINSASLQQEVLVSDSATPTLRKKPAGVIGMLLHRSVGVVPATDPAQIAFLGMFTRSNFAGDTFDASEAGKFASYVGRWTNAKGEEGPWSDIVNKIIPN